MHRGAELWGFCCFGQNTSSSSSRQRAGCLWVLVADSCTHCGSQSITSHFCMLTTAVHAPGAAAPTATHESFQPLLAVSGPKRRANQ
jgi:hypothetical protein